MTMTSGLTISVVICCYNSEKRLPDTLSHLSRQSLDSSSWELIVVDNNSSDDTAGVAEAAWRSLNSVVPLTVVKEPIAGLNHARIRGFKIAKSNAICFCDDDNWLSADYLKKAIDIFQQNPEVGLVGGKATAVFEGKKPEWFDKYQNFFACEGQYYHSGDITQWRGFLYGAGLCIRRSAFVMHEHVLLTQDRKRDSLSTWGDKEIGYLAVRKGWKVWYDEGLVLKHYMPIKRTSMEYLKKLIIGIDCQSFYLEGLAYQVGYHQEWYRHPWQRTWFYLLAQNLFKLREWIRFKDLGVLFSLKVQAHKVLEIFKWNFKYDKSFKSAQESA